jgi:hypothetical protein
MASVRLLQLANWRPLMGEDRSRRPVTAKVVIDPKRRFATTNCRSAKYLFDHLHRVNVEIVTPGVATQAGVSSSSVNQNL